MLRNIVKFYNLNILLLKGDNVEIALKKEMGYGCDTLKAWIWRSWGGTDSCKSFHMPHYCHWGNALVPRSMHVYITKRSSGMAPVWPCFRKLRLICWVKIHVRYTNSTLHCSFTVNPRKSYCIYLICVCICSLDIASSIYIRLSYRFFLDLACGFSLKPSMEWKASMLVTFSSPLTAFTHFPDQRSTATTTHYSFDGAQAPEVSNVTGFWLCVGLRQQCWMLKLVYNSTYRSNSI